MSGKLFIIIVSFCFINFNVSSWQVYKSTIILYLLFIVIQIKREYCILYQALKSFFLLKGFI